MDFEVSAYLGPLTPAFFPKGERDFQGQQLPGPLEEEERWWGIALP